MRELDLLLSDFLDHGYELLSGAERVEFEQLLGCADDDLLRWLTGRTVPNDPGLSRIIDAILSSRSD